MATPIRLTLPAGAQKGTTIEVNGHDIGSAVCGLDLHADPRGGTRLSLHLAVIAPVEVVGEATVVLPAETRDALIALGWTPPE